MTALNFSGSGYVAPAGIGMVLAFGVDATAAPEQTADNLRFWQTPYEAPRGTVNIQFGVTNEGGADPIALAVAVEASLARPEGSAFIGGIEPVIVFGEMPKPVADIDLYFDINVNRGPKAETVGVYSDAARLDEENRQTWVQSERLRTEPSSAYEQADPVRIEPQSGWSQSAKIRAAATGSYEQGESLRQSPLGIPWENPEQLTAGATGQYAEAEPLTRIAWGDFQFAAPLRSFVASDYQRAAGLSLGWATDFTQGMTCNWYRGSAYQEAGLPLPYRRALPPPPIPPEPLPSGIYDLQFGAGPIDDANINFGGIYYNTNTIPKRGFYIVNNTAQIVRVSDGRDVPAQAVTLSVDVDGYAWQMRAQLAGRDAIDLFEGTEADPFAALEIDVTINGYTWRILVDAWSRSRAWQGGDVTITGRSLTALLAAPYVEPTDYTLATQRLVQQVANDELPPGWGMNWTATDWLLPAESFSYSGQTPIGAISTLAKSAAAFIEPDRNTKVLRIKPLYPTAPWQWGDLTPDHVIASNFVIQSGSEKQPGESIDGVYVHGGEYGGVLAKVQRTGSGGVNLGQTIVDPLVTHIDAARAQGIAAIAATARQSFDSYEMGLSTEYGGLIVPGDLVSFGDNPDSNNYVEDSRGIVRGTTISAGATRSGNGVALKVRQSLNVERHLA